MIVLGSTLNPTREAGVVYTKLWMVELALEPSAGDGAFLSAMVRSRIARNQAETRNGALALAGPGTETALGLAG